MPKIITNGDANVENPESGNTPPVAGSIVTRCKDCIQFGTIKCEIYKENERITIMIQDSQELMMESL